MTNRPETLQPGGVLRFGTAELRPGPGGVVRWPLSEALAAAPAIACRNLFAEALSRKSARDIASSYVYMTLSQMRRLVKLALEHALKRPLVGYGIELGAGCGLLAAVVAEQRQVRGILALEVCEKMAELVVPKVSAWVLGGAASRVVPIAGSFDDLRLPDAALDFAIEIDSLHHSDNLQRTLSECARVLRPGAILLCFDRCHPDSLTDAEVGEMLDRVYSREFLAANHYPADARLTRRDNGEHEYRRFEWERAFKAAGFGLLKTLRLERALSARAAAKGLLSILPRVVRPAGAIGPRDTPHAAGLWLRQSWRRLAGLPRRPEVLAPWGGTVFLLEKP